MFIANMNVFCDVFVYIDENVFPQWRNEDFNELCVGTVKVVEWKNIKEIHLNGNYQVYII